tara:strand:- start:219 stop:716 length:498 start_codon:yes stop_codon:yes gene_type:complete
LARILGIDPGSRITGYGLVEATKGNVKHLEHGCLKLGKGSMHQRLLALYEGLEQVIQKLRPTEVAIEKVFVGASAQSALKLGQARGVAILASAQHNLAILEYSPNQIKKAVVGRGHADKAQVMFMTKVILSLPEVPESDAADALAVAVCHSNFKPSISIPGCKNK